MQSITPSMLTFGVPVATGVSAGEYRRRWDPKFVPRQNSVKVAGVGWGTEVYERWRPLVLLDSLNLLQTSLHTWGGRRKQTLDYENSLKLHSKNSTEILCKHVLITFQKRLINQIKTNAFFTRLSVSLARNIRNISSSSTVSPTLNGWRVAAQLYRSNRATLGFVLLLRHCY